MVDKISSLKPLEKIQAVTNSEPAQQESLTEAEKIQSWLKKKKRIEKNRTYVERQWLCNIAFLWGRQHYMISKRPTSGGVEELITWEFKNLDRQKKTLRTSNYILPLYRSLLARIMSMKSTVNVEPETQATSDIDSAKVAQQLLSDFWENANTTNPDLRSRYSGMPQTLVKLFSYVLSIAQGTLYPYFNEKAKCKAVVGGEVIESEIGAVEVECLHNFEFIRDPNRRFCFIQQVKSTDEIEDDYGIKVEAEDMAAGDFERQIQSLIDGTTEDNYEDSAKLYRYFVLPCKKYPNGKIFHFTEKKLLKEEDLPDYYKGCLPFFTFDYLDIPLMGYPQSMVEQLISLQEDYNFTLKRIADYKKWMTGKVMLPDGANLKSKWDDEVGQIVKYSANGKPEYQQAPQIPQALFEDLKRIRQDMEDIAATHDPSLARIPNGVKSGVAIENLAEQDNSQLAPQMQQFETQLGFFGKMVLDIMQAKYVEPRLIAISGDDLTAEVSSFEGDKAKGNHRIKVSMGSAMPASRQARQTFILNLEKQHIISAEKAKELLQFGDIEGIYTDIDKQAEKAEIKEMLKGLQIEPAPYENHAVRLKVLADFMMSPDYLKLKNSEDQQQVQLAHMIFEHYNAHQDMLLHEQQAASNGTQGPATGAPAGQPLPPQGAPGA